MENKNTNAIDKIIKELATRDYKSAAKTYPKAYKEYNAGIRTRKPRGYYQFSYSLGIETEAALQVKNDYAKGIITESEYKAYCLKYNLTH